MKLKDLEIIDLALYHKKSKTLIVADIHMGYEEALNKQGILIPRHQHIETLKRLEQILKKPISIQTIIINGDLKHEFGTISETEWRHTLRILDLLSKYCKKIILIKGNHDTILGPIAKKRNLEIKDYYIIDSYYICHGHIIPDNSDFKKSKTIIIAHDHPAVSLKYGPRIETYKCFLVGKYKRKTLIVMPSFNLVAEGTNVLNEELLSPFLHQDLKNFNVYIVSEKIFDFGKLKNLSQ
ncbi:metallophosphoesterase [Candidatus Woesearchaeota archaeon]|nr:metallophosphoesterase [Candidatus Woesearchaeota archaeon]